MGKTVSSMTGFARFDGAQDGQRWTWELKSVNGRGLEMRFRLPSGCDCLEPALRAALGDHFKRGSVFASLQMASSSRNARMRLNETALDDVIAAAETIRARMDCGPPQADVLLGLRGVMEMVEEEPDEAARERLNAEIVRSFEAAASLLNDSRLTEGAAIADVICGHVDEIETLTGKAVADASASMKAIRDRIKTQLSDLIASDAIPEDRLSQEAALLALKADVREELNRLTVHVGAARDLLARGGAVGRELDFLTQELNRETNTLCSKAQTMDLKRIGLDLKKVIDQLREQVQNVE